MAEFGLPECSCYVYNFDCHICVVVVRLNRNLVTVEGHVPQVRALAGDATVEVN